MCSLRGDSATDQKNNWHKHKGFQKRSSKTIREMGLFERWPASVVLCQILNMRPVVDCPVGRLLSSQRRWVVSPCPPLENICRLCNNHRWTHPGGLGCPPMAEAPNAVARQRVARDQSPRSQRPGHASVGQQSGRWVGDRRPHNAGGGRPLGRRCLGGGQGGPRDAVLAGRVTGDAAHRRPGPGHGSTPLPPPNWGPTLGHRQSPASHQAWAEGAPRGSAPPHHTPYTPKQRCPKRQPGRASPSRRMPRAAVW